MNLTQDKYNIFPLTFAVVGLGLMGHGVAQIVAQAGYQVLALETSQEAITKGMQRFVVFVFVFVFLF